VITHKSGEGKNSAQSWYSGFATIPPQKGAEFTMNIALESILAKLPIMKIEATIQSHTEPLLEILPDKRMKKVLKNMVLGILGGQTPVITGMARQNEKLEGETWAVAKSMYRLLGNKRLDTKVIYRGLYEIGQQVVEREKPEYLVVAVDPVNFEKPYTEASIGRCECRLQSDPTRSDWACPFDTWLPSHHGDHREHQSASHQLCQLVFVSNN
jgi:hypothetical protein